MTTTKTVTMESEVAEVLEKIRKKFPKYNFSKAASDKVLSDARRLKIK